MRKSLRKLLLMAAVLLVPWVTHAQNLSDYTLTVDTSTFTSIVSTGSSISFSSPDDGYGTVNMPFAFPFGESLLASGNSICVSSNGYMLLTGTSNSTSISYTNVTYRAVNPILGQDGHIGRHTGSGAYYQLDTTDDGIQFFTIEYHLLGRYSSPYGVYSYQVKFYENGNMEIVFDSVFIDGATTTTFRTFLWDGPNNDLAVVADSWASPSFGTSMFTRPTSDMPVHGLRYTFTRPIITCPKPAELTFFNIANDTASLRFVEMGTATSWMLEYADSMFVPGAGQGNLVNLTDTFYQFTGLLPQTTYYVYVHADCGGGDTSLNRFGSFRTPCTVYPHDSLPYRQGFEGWVTGSTGGDDDWVPGDPCWSFVDNYTSSSHYPYVSNSTRHTGTNSLYMYKPGSSYYGYFCLPLFEDSINTLEFSCWIYNGSYSTASYGVQLGVMTDPTDMSTFTLIETLYPTATSQWQKKEVDLSTYTGGPGYLTLLSPT